LGVARLSRSQLRSAWEFLWAWPSAVIDGASYATDDDFGSRLV
jgi:hypothetical protein